MNSAVVSTWNHDLIALSYVISVLGSFVALRAAGLMRRTDGRISRVNTLAAGLSMGGIGVWSMHFIGMVALDIDVASGYSLVETLASLIAAVLGASLALAYVAKGSGGLTRICTAGALLGLGVAVMHYLGMYGMRFGGYISWDPGLVLLSVAIAMAAATAALWLAFNTPGGVLRTLAALVMGIAVCTMHYTGMAAANYVCTTANRTEFPNTFGFIRADQLPLLVTGVACSILLLILIDQIAQKMLAPSQDPVAVR
jgi:NO-binding membrane sensor protein with MHYT domain